MNEWYTDYFVTVVFEMQQHYVESMCCEEDTAWCVEDSSSWVTVCVCICVLPLCSQPLRGQCWSVCVQAFHSHWHHSSSMMMSVTLLLATLGLLVQGETLCWKLCFRMEPGSPQWCSAMMEKHWNQQHWPSSIYSPCSRNDPLLFGCWSFSKMDLSQ